jgi:transposase
VIKASPSLVEGMNRRTAAQRFGVAPLTAVELPREWKATGAYEARRQGGDRRSGPIEAHAAQLVALVETTPDITLAEVADHLFAAHSERLAVSGVRPPRSGAEADG